MRTSTFGHRESHEGSGGHSATYTEGTTRSEGYSTGIIEAHAGSAGLENCAESLMSERRHERFLLDEFTDLDDIAGDHLFPAVPSAMPPVSLADLPPREFLNALGQDFELALLARDDAFTPTDEQAFIGRITRCFAAHRGRQRG